MHIRSSIFFVKYANKNVTFYTKHSLWKIANKLLGSLKRKYYEKLKIKFVKLKFFSFVILYRISPKLIIADFVLFILLKTISSR